MKQCVQFKCSILGCRTWIIEQSAQQCVLQSLSTDLSALRKRESEIHRVSVMSDHELLLECWWAAWWQNPSSWQQPRPLWFVLAAAYRVATWLLLPPISPGYTECIHSRSVIEFHTCHRQLNCVFCKVWRQHLQKFLSWGAWELSWCGRVDFRFCAHFELHWDYKFTDHGTKTWP